MYQWQVPDLTAQLLPVLPNTDKIWDRKRFAAAFPEE